MKKVLFLLSLLAMMALATGCGLLGGGDEETPPTAEAPTTTTETESEPGSGTEAETETAAPEDEGTTDTAVAEQNNEQIVTLYVGPEEVECTGVAPQTCLQVKLSPDEEYGLFYDTINGFEFEPGFEYVLQVQVEQIENPPADGSSLQYTLIQVVSKTPADLTIEGEGAGTGDSDGTADTGQSGTAATSLVGPTWQWESFIDPMGAASIPNAQLYTITFAADGTMNATADCNSATGSYTAEGDASGAMQIDVDATTLALCPEGSLGEEFLANLEAIGTYTIVDGKLYLDLVADSGTMILGTGETEATQPPPTTDPMPSDSLVGVPWQWASTDGQETPNPQNYIVEFMDDGMVAVKADCNNASGSYTIAAQNITIMMGPMTMAACPEGSLSDQFVANLGQVRTWQVENGTMSLGMEGAGTMQFTAVVLP